MGIELDEELDIFGSPCTAGFTGDTPKFIYVKIAGMKRGDQLMPDYGSPPNGTWKLEQEAHDDCHWLLTDGVWRFHLSKTLVQARFIATLTPEGFNEFEKNNPGPYWTWGNRWQSKINHWYYGGFAAATWIEDASPGSLGTMAKGFNIVRSSKTMGEVLVVSNNQSVLRIAQPDKLINISALIDFS